MSALFISIVSGCQPTITEVSPSTASATPQATATPTPSPTTSPATTNFTITGKITYDWVPAQSQAESGGNNRLAYSQKTQKAARRITVQAISGSSSVASGMTDDNGNYTVTVPVGNTVHMRAIAQSVVTGYVPDGIGPENCNGASWNAKVVDNLHGSAQFLMDGATLYNNAATGVNLNATMTFSGSAYTNRTAAPFAMLDTVLTEFEMVCSAAPSITFPQLIVNWGAGNTNGTYFTYVSSIGNLFIVGQDGVDTDEYDDHVIAHETGHYIENSFYRADTIGGTHALNDSLDPTVAMSEGWGNAASGMTFNDPIYVDTFGSAQANGFQIDVSAAPSAADDHGVYSETSVQYLLYSLYHNRYLANSGNGFDHIWDIFRNYQRTTPALTTIQSFGAYFNKYYSGDGLATLWSNASTGINTPTQSFTCSSGCSALSDPTVDIFDLDNDIGSSYAAAPRHYPESSASSFTSEFWRLYRTISSGTNTATAHDQTNFGNYNVSTDSPINKFGVNRWYLYVAPSGGTKTISVTKLNGSTTSCASSGDILDSYLYHNGSIVMCDDGTSFCSGLGGNLGTNAGQPGCPVVGFSATAGEVYILSVQGVVPGSGSPTAVSSWEIVVTP